MGKDKKAADPNALGIFSHYFAKALEFKLRSFLLDESNIMESSVTRILTEFDISHLSSDPNDVCRNDLEVCIDLAKEIMQNTRGTDRGKKAKEIWEAVVKKYNKFGGSLPDGGEQ